MEVPELVPMDDYDSEKVSFEGQSSLITLISDLSWSDLKST